MFPKPIESASPAARFGYQAFVPVALFIWLLPMVAIFMTSIRSAEDINSGNVFGWPSQFALVENYVAVFERSQAAMYLMKALALELAPERIRVNGLFPAVGDTPMLAEFAGGTVTPESAQSFANALPLGRLITSEDVAQAAVFLSSPAEAGAMTGCALPVDAGRCL